MSKKIAASMFVLLAMSLCIGGCPQPSGGTDDAVGRIEPVATDSDGDGPRSLISPGRYIGLITTIISQRTTNGVTVDIADDGTVSVNNSRYARGDVIFDSIEDTQLARTIVDVSRTSNTILIQYTEVWERGGVVHLIGEGSTRLLWTDARTIDYFDANFTLEIDPPTGFEPFRISAESSGELTR